MNWGKLGKIVLGAVFALTNVGSGVWAGTNNLPVDMQFHENTPGRADLLSETTLEVTTFTDRTIADGDFDVGQGYTFRTNQPNTDSVTLYRDTSGSRSLFNGSIESNGKLFFVNPNGMLFGTQSSVATNGLVASVLDIQNDDFLAGNYQFQGDSVASIDVNGNLNTGEEAVFIGPNMNFRGGQTVANDVAIGLGQKAYLKLGDNMSLNLQHDRASFERGSFQNTGLIQARDGSVYITSKTQMSTDMVNSGNIEASQDVAFYTNKGNVDNRGGQIAAGSSLVVGSVDGDVYTGSVSAEGAALVVGDSVHVSTIDANQVHIMADGDIINAEGQDAFISADKELFALSENGGVKNLTVESSDVEVWGGNGNVEIINEYEAGDVELTAVSHGDLEYTQSGSANLNVNEVYGINSEITHNAEQGEVHIDFVHAQKDVTIESNGAVKELDGVTELDHEFDVVSQEGRVTINSNETIGRGNPLEVAERGEDVSHLKGFRAKGVTPPNGVRSLRAPSWKQNQTNAASSVTVELDTAGNIVAMR